MQIVGNGLLGREFKKFISPGLDVLIVASGVSNSLVISDDDCLREEELLSKLLNKVSCKVLPIYLSSCAIQAEGVKTKYMLHKSKMERLFLSKCDGTIFRLPQVVGPGANPVQLVPWLFRSTIEGFPVQIQRGATRNIILASDVAKISIELAKKIIQGEVQKRSVYIIANTVNLFVPEILCLVESIVGKKARVSFILDGLASLISPSEEQHEIARNLKISFDEKYTERTLQIYYDWLVMHESSAKS